MNCSRATSPAQCLGVASSAAAPAEATWWASQCSTHPAIPWETGHSTEHGVEAHVLAHLGPLFLVVHQQLAVLEVLPLFFPLRGDKEPPHADAGELTPAGVLLADAGGWLLAEGPDDLVVK